MDRQLKDVLVYYGGGRATNGERSPGPTRSSDEMIRQQWDLPTRLRSRDDRQPGRVGAKPDQSGPERGICASHRHALTHAGVVWRHTEEVQPDSAEVGAIAAKIEARNRRNNAALLLDHVPGLRSFQAWQCGGSSIQVAAMKQFRMIGWMIITAALAGDYRCRCTSSTGH